MMKSMATLDNDRCISDKTVRSKLARFDKDFSPYLKALSLYYDDEFGDAIRSKTRAHYAALLPSTPQFAGRLNLFNLIIRGNVLVVAFYRSMTEHGKSALESARVAYNVADGQHRAIPLPMRWLLRQFLFSRLFLWIVRRASKRVEKHPRGWQIEYKRGENGSSNLEFECKKCGVIEYYRAHDAMAIAPYCNMVDYIQGRTLKLGLVNPQNIGRGDSICREQMKRGRETPIPENLSEVVNGDLEKRSPTPGSHPPEQA